MNSVYQRIAGILHGIIIAGIKIYLKRENHEHPVHQPLDFLYPSRVPSPNLRGDVIEYGDARFLDKFSHPEIKTTVVHENHDIRPPCQNILVTGLDIRLDFVQIFQDGQETHDGRILVMTNDLTSGLPHQITSPSADFRIRIKLFQSLDQIRGMQITRGLSRNNVVFHWLFSILWAKIEKDFSFYTHDVHTLKESGSKNEKHGQKSQNSNFHALIHYKFRTFANVRTHGKQMISREQHYYG